MAVSGPVAAVGFEREIAAIERGLSERGSTERRELARLRFWGPCRFGSARHAAVRGGQVRRVSRTRYGPSG
jgi:hypothetical protein